MQSHYHLIGIIYLGLLNRERINGVLSPFWSIHGRVLGVQRPRLQVSGYCDS